MINLSLKNPIERAYDVRDFSFVGPGWLDTERLTFLQNCPKMRQRSSYSHDASSSPRTIQGRSASGTKNDARIRPDFGRAGSAKLEPAEASKGSSTNTGRGTMRATATSMAHFADMLARQLNQPVQDFTGLSGIYNFKLEWAPDHRRFGIWIQSIYGVGRIDWTLKTSRSDSAAILFRRERGAARP